jgi:hypothetical protein
MKCAQPPDIPCNCMLDVLDGRAYAEDPKAQLLLNLIADIQRDAVRIYEF